MGFNSGFKGLNVYHGKFQCSVFTSVDFRGAILHTPEANDMSVFQLIRAPKLLHNRGGTAGSEGADRTCFPGTSIEFQVTCTQNVLLLYFPTRAKII